jgi:hypothetical protein
MSRSEDIGEIWTRLCQLGFSCQKPLHRAYLSLMHGHDHKAFLVRAYVPKSNVNIHTDQTYLWI